MMRLSPETQDELERFFREHRGDARLRLPPVSIHGGSFARLLTRAAGVSAITFGRHVFVAPRLLRRRAGGRVRMEGWLLAHEAAHVLQYAERGWPRFLWGYLRGYFRGLKTGRGWGRTARTAAYLSIAEEREARAAEEAFAARRAQIRRAD
ncbi:MAG TPA: DUF4157 domain-containing protein [Pyrinomonadaceae bacterium]|nr:DUF4157 domain-containing protein [Pyrinomonadaceae bacterium]